jgi:metallo-beta-lactamase family protein
MVSLQFLGAAGTVTGSKHLLKTPSKKILIDCGLFQGIKQLRLKNREPLPIDPQEIDLAILTHAHLDHCGYLPLLVKHGYKGEVLTTPPTKDLTQIILLDSAKIQEEDAEKANRHGYASHVPAEPLYTIKEAERSLTLLKTVDAHIWYKINEDISFRYLMNGHILGSAFIEMMCYGKKIIFSGDIGRSNSELLMPPEIIPEADVLIMESTYGDRNHPAVSSKDQLADVINETMQSNGNLLIPSFAVGRAQELMHLINELKKETKIPDLPVYMDSPMGASATHILEKYPEWHKLAPDQCHHVFNDVKIITEFSDTRKTVNDPHIKIVIAASGMITGGRVLEYLGKYIEDARNTVLLVGYQAEGTRGRSLRNGAHEIKLFGKYFQVLAKVREINGLSAHADQSEMVKWLHGFQKFPEKLFLVHGEPAARDAFRVKIEDEFKVVAKMPLQNEEFSVEN